jgi:hypothetical protein
MNIPAIAARAVAAGFRVASSVIPQATFVLSTNLGLDPVHDTIAPVPTKKTVQALAYRDQWRKSDGTNVRTDVLLVQVWTDGTPTPGVNDYVILNGTMRKIASVETDPAGVTWEFELLAPSGLLTP